MKDDLPWTADYHKILILKFCGTGMTDSCHKGDIFEVLKMMIGMGIYFQPVKTVV